MASTNYTIFIALYAAIIGYFLLCHFAEERKCNSLVFTIYITFIYTGRDEKACSMSSVQDKGRTQDFGHSYFPIWTYLDHKIILFFVLKLLV